MLQMHVTLPNSQQKSKDINDVKQTLRHLQAFNKIVIFKWVPSHVGLKIADKLAKIGTTLHNTETRVQADTLKKFLNRKIATKYEQEADKLAAAKKWREIHKIWAKYKGKPRKEMVANFRLKTGHDCLATHLRKIGIYECSEYTICQIPNSTMDK
jgi:hypothetical protein